jgi:hypothetical protein
MTESIALGSIYTTIEVGEDKDYEGNIFFPDQTGLNKVGLFLDNQYRFSLDKVPSEVDGVLSYRKIFSDYLYADYRSYLFPADFPGNVATENIRLNHKNGLTLEFIEEDLNLIGFERIILSSFHPVDTNNDLFRFADSWVTIEFIKKGEDFDTVRVQKTPKYGRIEVETFQVDYSDAFFPQGNHITSESIEEFLSNIDLGEIYKELKKNK